LASDGRRRAPGCLSRQRLVNRTIGANVESLNEALVAGDSLRRGSGYYRQRESDQFIISGALTWIGVGIYWCLLWRSGVQWTSRRITGTIVAGFGAFAFGLLAAVFIAMTFSIGDGQSFEAFVGGMHAIIVWLIATVFIWRETAAERARRVTASSASAITCPTCGYNLTGLTEARCPECGSKFTLDELLASQQTKSEVEIE
jgi:hypothetical protein